MRRMQLLAAVAAVCVAGDARAAFITGIGNPSTAIPGGTVITFDSGPTGRFTPPTTVTLSGVTIGGVGGTFDIDGDFIGQFNTRGVNALSNDNFTSVSTSTFTFDFSAPTSAFAFLFGASDAGVWRVNAFNAANALIESYLIPATQSSNAGDYFGISAAGITRATVTNTGAQDYVFIDNFTFTPGSVTVASPAPATLLLVVGAAGLIGAGRRVIRA